MMNEAKDESIDENEAGMVDNPEAKMAHVLHTMQRIRIKAANVEIT